MAENTQAAGHGSAEPGGPIWVQTGAQQDTQRPYVLGVQCPEPHHQHRAPQHSPAPTKPTSPQGMPQQLCSPSLPCPSGRNISAQEWPRTAFVMLQQKQHSSLILLGHLQKAIRSSALPTPRSSQSHPCSCSPPANRGKEFQFAPEHGEPCRQRMCWGREALMGSGTVQGLKRQFWLKTSFCSDLSCECAFFPFSC